MPREIEIKLPLGSAVEGRRLLRSAGFRLAHRRVFEANTLYDTPRYMLRRACSLLRIRETGRQTILTFKGPAAVGRYKSREEIEVTCSDARTLATVLTRLEFTPTFRYEKYRTEYRRTNEAGLATLDETPVGTFLELEGPPAWIDRNARRMGFGTYDYITDSYYGLYVIYCRRHRLRPTHMTFSSTKRKPL